MCQRNFLKWLIIIGWLIRWSRFVLYFENDDYFVYKSWLLLKTIKFVLDFENNGSLVLISWLLVKQMELYFILNPCGVCYVRVKITRSLCVFITSAHINFSPLIDLKKIHFIYSLVEKIYKKDESHSKTCKGVF